MWGIGEDNLARGQRRLILPSKRHNLSSAGRGERVDRDLGLVHVGEERVAVRHVDDGDAPLRIGYARVDARLRLRQLRPRSVIRAVALSRPGTRRRARICPGRRAAPSPWAQSRRWRGSGLRAADLLRVPPSRLGGSRRREYAVDGVETGRGAALEEGHDALQMAAAARTRRRSGTRTDRLEGRPLGRSETGPPALGL